MADAAPLHPASGSTPQEESSSPSTSANPPANETSNAERKARKDQKRAAKAKSLANKAVAATADPATSNADVGADADAQVSPQKLASKKVPHRNDPRSQPVDVQLSKALAYILRHGALKEGLKIRQDGYIPLDDVLARPRVKSLNMASDGGKARKPNLEDVQRIVESNEKQRFQIAQEDGVWLVRAVQGHSLNQVTSLEHVALTLDNLDLLQPGTALADREHDERDNARSSTLESRLAATRLEVEPAANRPPLVIHGTDARAWELIQQSGGLKPMTRNHIHLAKGKLGEQGVISGMRKSASRLLFVDIRAAIQDGIRFFLSSNGVVLTPGAVPEGTAAAAMDPGSDQDRRGAAEGPTRSQGGGGTGLLPLAYVVRVEDAKGQVVWTRGH